MSTKILMVVIWTSFINCHGQQQHATTIKNDTMERFDIRRFQEDKIGDEYNFTLEDGTEIRQYETVDSYEQVKTKKNSPIETYTGFYKTSGTQIGSGDDFYGQPIGVYKEYDSSGELIKETDFEKPYKKNIYDIAKIMLDSFGVDIIHPKNLTDILVSRSTSPNPHYQVLYKISDTLQGNVTISAGKTSTIISKKETMEQLEDRKYHRTNKENKDEGSAINPQETGLGMAMGNPGGQQPGANSSNEPSNLLVAVVVIVFVLIVGLLIYASIANNAKP